MLILNWVIFIVNCTENAGGISLYFATAFFKYKVKYLKQMDSKFTINFHLMCISMGKRFNKFGEINCIYKSLIVFCAINPLVVCLLSILTIFQISCTCILYDLLPIHTIVYICNRWIWYLHMKSICMKIYYFYVDNIILNTFYMKILYLYHFKFLTSILFSVILLGFQEGIF